MIQAIANVQMASFRGAADISVGSILHSLPTTIQKSYTDFFAFYFQHTDLSQNSFRIIPINIALFITVLGVMLYLLFSDSRIKILYKVLICALIALIPIFANVIDIIASSTDMYLTSIGGMLILMPLGVSLVLRTIRFNPHVVAKSVIIILCLLLSYTNVLQINADTSVMIHNQNQAVSLANRIWTRIEEKYPEDLRNQTIAIMGIPSMNEEFSSSAMFYNNANWYARIGMFWNDWNGAAGSWTTLFRNDLGIMINYCNHDQFREIADNEAYQQMPVYPAEGCIQKINDIIVVKLVAEEAIAEWY
ncbi:MAG: hypothetical protein EOM64_09065 [Erysipelotrichia bacterium]|nr:hypothetical protein [Erysipelotrichia bacterium]